MYQKHFLGIQAANIQSIKRQSEFKDKPEAKRQRVQHDVDEYEEEKMRLENFAGSNVSCRNNSSRCFS